MPKAKEQACTAALKALRAREDGRRVRTLTDGCGSASYVDDGGKISYTQVVDWLQGGVQSWERWSSLNALSCFDEARRTEKME